MSPIFPFSYAAVEESPSCAVLGALFYDVPEPVSDNVSLPLSDVVPEHASFRAFLAKATSLALQ